MAKGTLKFKDSVADFERITGEIAARKFAGIYLLMGEEGYFIDAVAEQLAASILDEAARAFNQITVYGRDSDAGQVVNLCRQMPMMGQYQVVIVKEAQQQVDAGEFPGGDFARDPFEVGDRILEFQRTFGHVRQSLW